MPSTPVENLLIHLGLPDTEATKIANIPEAEHATFDLKPYAEKVRANYQTQFKNDPAFFSDITIENLPPEVKKKMESAQFGRAAKITTEKLIKGLGMTEADYADLPEETKEKIELLIPAIAERYTKTKTGAKEVQEQLIAERKKTEELLKKYGPDYENEVKTKYESEANQKITTAIFNANLIGELSTIPGLKIAASDISKTASDLLQSKYGFELVGSSVELRNKSNPALKALREGSSKEITLKDALTEIATERGWVEKAAGDPKGTGTFKVEPNGKGALEMVVAPHIADKISAKIAAEAKS